MKPTLRPLFGGSMWWCRGNDVDAFDTTMELAFALWIECLFISANFYYKGYVPAPVSRRLT
jgi:hypothetical protein